MRFFALLLVVGLPVLPQALDKAKLAGIAPRMKEFVDAGKAAGVVTLVAHKGEVAQFEAVGYTDMETRQPMTKENIFQLHSMTKPIVALAAMQLAEEGRLSLADAVEKHLPEFRGQMVIAATHADGSRLVRKPSRLITVRDLMTHTSGMMLNPPPGIGELHGALHKSLADVTLILSQQALDTVRVGPVAPAPQPPPEPPVRTRERASIVFNLPLNGAELGVVFVARVAKRGGAPRDGGRDAARGRRRAHPSHRRHLDLSARHGMLGRVRPPLFHRALEPPPVHHGKDHPGQHSQGLVHGGPRVESRPHAVRAKVPRRAPQSA